RVLVEPERHRLQEQVDGTRHGELDARGLGDAHLAPVHTDGAVEVARGERGERRDDDDGRRERDDAAVERQLEEVEGDVEAELRVGLTRWRAVEPHERGLPARRRGDAGKEAEGDRDAEGREATQRLDDLLVTIELCVELRVDGATPERNLDAD